MSWNRKKIMLLAVTGMTVVGLGVGGATYAIFTDTATTSHDFTSGTLHLKQQRDNGDTIPGPMFYSAASDPTGKFPYDTTKNDPYAPPGGEALGGWAPGDTATRAMNLINDGTLDIKVNQLKATVNSAGVTQGGAYNEFIKHMHIKVMYPAQNKVLYDGYLDGLLGGFVNVPNFIIAAPPSGPANITFEAALDASTGNVIQGKSFVFDFTFNAQQAKNNP